MSVLHKCNYTTHPKNMSNSKVDVVIVYRRAIVRASTQGHEPEELKTSLEVSLVVSTGDQEILGSCNNQDLCMHAQATKGGVETR